MIQTFFKTTQRTERAEKTQQQFIERHLVDVSLKINNSEFTTIAPVGASLNETISALVIQDRGLAVWVDYPELKSSQLIGFICGNEILIDKDSIGKLKDGRIDGDPTRLGELIKAAENAPDGGIHFYFLIKEDISGSQREVVPLHISGDRVSFTNGDQTKIAEGQNSYSLRNTTDIFNYNTINEMKEVCPKSQISPETERRLRSAHNSNYTPENASEEISPNSGYDLSTNTVISLEKITDATETSIANTQINTENQKYRESIFETAYQQGGFHEVSDSKKEIGYNISISLDNINVRGAGGFANVDYTLPAFSCVTITDKIEDLIKITNAGTPNLAYNSISEDNKYLGNEEKIAKNAYSIDETGGKHNFDRKTEQIIYTPKRSKEKIKPRPKIVPIDIQALKSELRSLNLRRAVTKNPEIKNKKIQKKLLQLAKVVQALKQQKTTAQKLAAAKIAKIRKAVERISLQISVLIGLKKQIYGRSKFGAAKPKIDSTTKDKKLNLLVNKFELELLKLLKIKKLAIDKKTVKLDQKTKDQLDLLATKLGLKKGTKLAIANLLSLYLEGKIENEKMTDAIKKLLEIDKKRKLERIAKIHLLILLLNFYLKSKGTKLRMNRKIVR